MPNEQTTISTRDGECSSHVATPASDGPWPAVIFYMDAGGIRPVAVEMAQRLADAGYVVLLPDLFYRYGPYGPLVPKEVFAGDIRAILGPMMATTGNDKAAQDTEAFLAYLDTRGDVAGREVPPEMAERFEKALAQAGVRYQAETYPAAHGWMKPDFPVYEHAAAERGWAEMLALFSRSLHRDG